MTLNALQAQVMLRYSTLPIERTPSANTIQPCGGSSAGSAVGVSAGFAPIALGTQTGGSLIYPASKAGLYGMLPTLSTVSADGAFRISRTYDGIGGIAKTPDDLLSLIETILLPETGKSILESEYSSVMKGSWEGLKIGVVESTYGCANPEKWASELVVSSTMVIS
jgi:amidase